MAKHLGDASLTQLLTLVKEKIDTLLNKIEEKQEPFVVTATANFEAENYGTLIDFSKSLSEIRVAYDRGDHVILNLDIGQIMPGYKATIPLMNVNENEAIFAFTPYLNEQPVLAMGGIKKESGTFIILTPLAMKSQLGAIDSILDAINGEVV